MANPVNAEIKKVVERVKTAQAQLQSLVKNQDWVDEARKYAERQGKEVKKLLSANEAKVKSFLEKEKKELERFQKQIPGEVKKLRAFVLGQRKEIEKLLASVRKASQANGGKTSGGKAKTVAKPRKKASASKTGVTPSPEAPIVTPPTGISSSDLADSSTN